ncbi:hypothetical protein TRICHSKD4_4660 [Roseibium sp. TrichSKD4]|uniref:hypothetical protein n=1 Tax=Roseibium sp. TrichSKD4 TaxID=744980 RepID=UPI0001E57701|nr:hypothetical protein [Roseibium sp. TrichSKD4]EFO28850.1 hypothetical protein TRICHSKD4_4660 [Roseibium sp. TrichSKD4]
MTDDSQRTADREEEGSPSKVRAAKKDAEKSKDERLAEALRANLRRRKAAAKKTAEPRD